MPDHKVRPAPDKREISNGNSHVSEVKAESRACHGRLCFFDRNRQKTRENFKKSSKKHEKVLAFPGIRGILMSHYALKQGAPLPF